VSIDMEEAYVTLLYSSCVLYNISAFSSHYFNNIHCFFFFLNILVLHDSLNCILTEFTELSKIKN